MPRLLLLAALAALAARPALAQTCSTSWATPTDGGWSVAANWTAGVPETGDVACITVSGTYTVSIGGFEAANAGTLIVGGDSGTQTLTSQGYPSVGSATIRPNGRLELVNITPGGDDGLYATGTVTVEGEITVPGGVSFLRTGGTLDVAPGGTLRVSGTARVGDVSSRFRIRGTVEGVGCPFPATNGQCIVLAPVEVLGGTLRAASGVLLLQAGGTMDGATLDAGPAAALLLNADLAGPPYQYTLEGTIQGSPEGYVAWQGAGVLAGPPGATLAVGGTGLQLQGASLASGGGSFTNTGRLREAETESNFSTFDGVTVHNEGTIEFPASFEFANDAVLRNEPGATILFSAGNGLSGTGRFKNAGLLLREGNRPAISPTVGFSGLLFSLPGSEIRVLDGTQVNLDAPGAQTLPRGTTVTGTGTLGTPGTLDHEGTISPGTDAEPLATLTVASYFRPSLTAGDPRLVVDVDTDGRSDTLRVMFAPGSQNTRLGGTLAVRVRPGYVPALGDTFVILTSGSAVEGEFAQVVTEGLPSGLAFTAEVSPDGLAVVLRVESAVASADGPGPGVLVLSVAPNPTHGPIRLALTAGAAGSARVEVVDALGRRVALVHDGPLAAGTTPLAFDATRLPAGVYTVRAVTAGGTTSRALTVVR